MEIFYMASYMVESLMHDYLIGFGVSEEEEKRLEDFCFENNIKFEAGSENHNIQFRSIFDI